MASGLLLADHPRVHVSGNHVVYFNADDPRDNVSPDVHVALAGRVDTMRRARR